MTLTQFFAALQNPQNFVVNVTETDNGADKSLARLYADGYEQLLAATLARTVDKITVVSNKEITVHLSASL